MKGDNRHGDNPLLHQPAPLPIFRRVSICRLLSVLALLVLVAMPVAMPYGAAMAAPVTQPVAAEHCDGMAGDRDQRQPAAWHDCVLGCSAITPAAEPMTEKVATGLAVHDPLPLVAFEGVEPLAETPPPRFS